MLVYGKNVLLDMEPKRVRKAYISNKNQDVKVLEYLKQNRIRYELVPVNRMNQMMKGKHQGVILDIDEYQYSDLKDCYEQNFVLILDHLEDPHNLGAIIRSAEAAGIRYIIIPKDRGVRVNETVMKVSAGALDRVNIVLVTNIAQTIKLLQNNGFMVYASAMDGVDYRTISYHFKRVLIIGNEGKGISPLVRKTSDEIITIPMNGKVNSLNASVAAGIFMFHMLGGV